jgi:multidrug efflux system membrane fusion protein
MTPPVRLPSLLACSAGGGIGAVTSTTASAAATSRIQIVSGLKPGDIVVVDGADRLREGSKVRISPEGEVAANINNGPGAPPGQQPNNAREVPPSFRVQPDEQQGSARQDAAGPPSPLKAAR